MLKQIPDMPDHVIAFDLLGTVTADDYKHLLTPLVKEKLSGHNKIDCLVRLKQELTGIEAGAMWEDIRLGLGNLGKWGRIAIVADKRWIENSVEFFGYFWPGHLQHFDLDEFESAKSWVSESDRARVHCVMDELDGIAIVQPDPDHALSEDDFESITRIVDAYLKNNNTLNGIMIKTKTFPGWQGMGAMISHMKFIRDHHHKVKKIALVTDSPMGKFADSIGDHFIKARVRTFEDEDYRKAIDWLRAGL